MMFWKFGIVLSLLLGSFCVQTSVGRTLHDIPPGPDPRFSSGSVFAPGPADHFAVSFTESLCLQLLKSDDFIKFCSLPMTKGIASKIGLKISQSLTVELGFHDISFSSKLTTALTSLSSGARPEVYARVLANSLVHILLSNSKLNFGNAFTLANIAAKVILSCVSVELYSDIGLGAYAGIDIGAGLILGLDENLGFDASLGLDADLDLFTALEAEIGLDLAAGIDLDAEFGLGLAADIDLDAEFGLGLAADLDAEFGLGLAADFDLDAELNLGLDADIDAEFNLGLDADIDAEFNLGLGADTNANLDLAAEFEVANSLVVDASLNADLDLDVDAKIDVNVGLNIDLSVSAKVNDLFQKELMKELLKDKYFRYVFSDFVPPLMLKQIWSIITEYISEAFPVPLPVLLALENNLLKLPSDLPASPELYAKILSFTLTKILSSINCITVATVRLQITIAASAITSGIASFIDLSKIPGVGLSINQNYNPYFSLLDGLGRLPYVGNDATSSIFPPVAISVQSSRFANWFHKVLFESLVSSNEFAQAFSLSISTHIYKSIGDCLGDCVAEAFGSPHAAFFKDIYSKSLRTIAKVDCRTYAEALTVSTTKSLHLLGYFSSGNVHIQAAIAFNAIIGSFNKILKITSNKVVLFPKILSLPWKTELIYAKPSDIVKKYGLTIKEVVGFNIDFGLDIYLGLDFGLGVGLDLGLDVGFGLDAAVDIGAGLDGAVDIRSGLDAVVDISAELGAAVDISEELDAAVDGLDAAAGLDVGGELGVKAGLGLGLGIGTKIQASVNAQFSVLNVFAQSLSNKLYQSVALRICIKMVGTRKVINLISQAMANEFGLPVATIFLKFYEKYSVKKTANSSELKMIVLAMATTEALGSAGILCSPFSVSTANQLATAVAARFSMLMATSMETKERTMRPQWTYLLNGGVFQPPLAPGYNIFRDC